MVSARSLGIALLTCAALSACTADRTEIIVAVGSNLAVPAELDAIRIDVVAPGSTMAKTSMATLGPGEPPLPRTLGLVHEEGPLGPFEIRVAGRRGGFDVIERRARVSFLEGRTLLLRMDLSRSCLGSTCEANRTCINGTCAAFDVSAESLPEWNGSVPGADAGPVARDAAPVRDAGSCVPMEERCNSLDDDCDGDVDETFDFMNDSNHCGGCDNVCGVPNRACCSGECGRC